MIHSARAMLSFVSLCSLGACVVGADRVDPGPNRSLTGEIDSAVVDPIEFEPDSVFTLESGTTNYVVVPSAYDASHETPMTLFVWLHGCGGSSEDDIWTAAPGGQNWISLAVGGAEYDCWDMDTGPDMVLAAIDELETHFNVARDRVILGGYSSGGDLSYRTAFFNAERFAGVLSANSSPFRDSGVSADEALGAAAWPFNVVQLAHLQDDTYPIDGVREETAQMEASGHPVTLIEVDGTHWDDEGDGVPGTSADIATYLFPYLNAGWTAP